MTEKEFAANWIEKIKVELKTFPDDFTGGHECQVIYLPGKVLFLPPPLFGSYQIIDESGETIFSTHDHFKAKYVIYGNRLKPSQLKIPVDELHVYEAVRDYERYLDANLKEMEKDFRQYYPNSKSFKRISIQVFSSLNLIRQ